MEKIGGRTLNNFDPIRLLETIRLLGGILLLVHFSFLESLFWRERLK